MNRLKEWGFSTQWWRGERGEYWVLGQSILFIGFILLPIYPAIDVDHLPSLWRYVGWGGTGCLGLIAGLLLLLGVMDLGANLTPLPHPKDESTLITIGVYGLVRHPIYSGVILLALAYSCWQWSVSHTIGAVILLIFFDIKARQEEAWLKTKFAEYESYRSKVKKLIPWVY